MLRIIYVDHDSLRILTDRTLSSNHQVPAPGEKVSLLGAVFTVHSYTILTAPRGLLATVLLIPPNPFLEPLPVESVEPVKSATDVPAA